MSALRQTDFIRKCVASISAPRAGAKLKVGFGAGYLRLVPQTAENPFDVIA